MDGGAMEHIEAMEQYARLLESDLGEARKELEDYRTTLIRIVEAFDGITDLAAVIARDWARNTLYAHKREGETW